MIFGRIRSRLGRYVFNDKNLWGNLQNEHPAFIYYDFEVKWQWKELLSPTTAVVPHGGVQNSICTLSRVSHRVHDA